MDKSFKKGDRVQNIADGCIGVVTQVARNTAKQIVGVYVKYSFSRKGWREKPSMLKLIKS